MIEALYSEDADAMLAQLESDPAHAPLLAATVRAITLVCDDPGSAEARRRRYDVVDDRHFFGVPYRSGDHDWIVFWEPGAEDDTIVITYIGPEP